MKTIIVKRKSGTTNEVMDRDTICGIPLDMVKAVALDGESFIERGAREFVCVPSDGHLGKQTLDKKKK